MDILVIIFAVATAALAIFTAFILMAYVQPCRTTVAKYFIEAKKKKKPLVFLDNGTTWFPTLLNKLEAGWGEDSMGDKVNIMPGALKMCPGGILFGAGDGFKGNVLVPMINEIIEQVKRDRITAAEMRAAIKKMEEPATVILPDDKVNTEGFGA